MSRTSLARLLPSMIGVLLTAAALVADAPTAAAAPSPSPRPAVSPSAAASAPSARPSAAPKAAAPKAAAPRAALATSVVLTASGTVLTPGQTVTLTASTSPVVHSGFIEIFDLTTQAHLVSCFPDVSCPAKITKTGGSISDYMAFLTTADGSVLSQLSIIAQSSPVTVTWLTVTLSSTQRVLAPGSNIVLTALTRADMNGFDGQFDLYIYDQTTGSKLAECNTGVTCSAGVLQTGPTVHTYTAFVATDNSTAFPPPNVRAQSSVTVFWGTVFLDTGNTPVAAGTSTTLTATTSFDVGPSPDFIKVYDAIDNVLLPGRCGFSTTVCTFTVSQSQPGVHVYVAFVAGSDDSLPPTYHLVSNNRILQWL